MLLKQGDKIHVMTRRQFESDVRRHFAGEVRSATESAVLATGFTFVFNTTRNEFARRSETRTRVVSLIDSANIINLLPDYVDIEDLAYELSVDNRLYVTDGDSFLLDINEFGHAR